MLRYHLATVGPAPTSIVAQPGNYKLHFAGLPGRTERRLSTGTIEIEVLPEHPTAWGKPARGLQWGIVLSPASKDVLRVGDKVGFVVRVRNLGDQERIVTVPEPWAGDHRPRIRSKDGEIPVQGPPRDARVGYPQIRIPAGGVREIDAGTFTVQPLLEGLRPIVPMSFTVVAPGAHQVRYVVFEGDATNVEAATGSLTLTIVDDKKGP
jgi:hypothetical protein